MSVLDPEAKDVVSLDDKALRELARRLCEAELTAHGVTAAGVMAGGHQNAPDGGIDVWADASLMEPLGYLPRLPLTIQAKATKMGEAAISSEMRPKGSLRPSIVELGQKGGAYIIACGREDLPKPTYDKRVAAMAKAFDASTPPPVFDFYDASRLANWACQHRSVTLWLLEKAGRPARGWYPLANWSAPEQNLDGALLVDEATRLKVGPGGEPLRIPEGLDALRRALVDRQVLRLLGQSGMGKTRLVQALFDARLGQTALPSSLAVYGDAGEVAPEVSPLSMARRLVERREKAVLIVDNCTAVTHRQLAQEARRPDATFSLLTIDFDVGHDQPEKTLVARLERVGDNLIEQLLHQRAPHLSTADIRRVAVFSEGNTRIALALADTAETSGSLARLDDIALVDRLFLRGRREHDETLHQVARIGSLVYAFHVEADADAPNLTDAEELSTLCALAGLSEPVFLDKLGDLLARGLAQQRGRQRAILPQALAIHLARDALGRTTTARLRTAMQAAPPRLLKSFTRRLGHLHDSPQAVTIAQALLAPGMALARPNRQDAEAIEILTNLAPLAPRRALEILQDYVAHYGVTETIVYTNQAVRQVTHLALALTYEADLFDEAAELLGRLVVGQDESRMLEHLRPRFTQLFQIIRSGTEATPDQRFALLDKLLASEEASVRQLGFDALKAALKPNPQSNHSVADFGARRRNNGWWRVSDAEVTAWFGGALDRCLAQLSSDEAGKAREVLAHSYVDAVRIRASGDLMADSMSRAAGNGFWGAGWFAACAGLARWKGVDQTQAMRDCEEALRPKTLRDRFDAFNRQGLWTWKNPDREDEDDYADGRRRAREIGRDAVGAREEGQALIKTALSEWDLGAVEFGAGLAEAASDLDCAWTELLDIARSIAAEQFSAWPLAGFIRGARLRDPKRVEVWLEAALADPLIAPFLPLIEAESGEASSAAFCRVLKVVEQGNADPRGLVQLEWLSPAADVAVDDLARLVEALVDLGFPRAGQRLLDDQRIAPAKARWTKRLKAAGLKVLAVIPLSKEAGGVDDYHLEKLARCTLPVLDAEPTVTKVLGNIIQRLTQDSNAFPHGLPGLLTVFANHYPLLLLDALIRPESELFQHRIDQLLKEFDDDERDNFNVLGLIPLEVLADWMALDPQRRARLLVRLVPYIGAEANGELNWSPIMRHIMATVDADPEIASELDNRVGNGGGDGPGERFARRLALVEALKDHPAPGWRDWAVACHGYMVAALDFYRQGQRSEPRFE